MDHKFRPSISSLQLQGTLYFNVLFSLFFTVMIVSTVIYKAMRFERYIPMIALAVWILMEPVRLWFGFSGNLKEKVPDIATYLLISIFPQFPLVIFLAYGQKVNFPIDPIIGSLMIIFLV